MHASAKEYSEEHALLSTTSADVALPMCSSTVPTLIDSANDPKTESWCFLWRLQVKVPGQLFDNLYVINPGSQYN